MPTPPTPDEIDPEPIEIVPATIDDRKWAAALMARSDPWITLGRGLDHCRRACLDPQYVVFVARRGGERLGFARLHPMGVAGSPYLASIAVTEDARGQGVGGHLLDFVEALYREQSRHLFLCVSSFNPRARALYERRGYERIGELENYVIDGASEFLMHKWLRRD